MRSILRHPTRVRRTGSAAGQFNPDEVTVQDMKKALDNPSLGIKVIDVRSPREMAAAPISRGKPGEYEIAKVDGVPLLLLSQINKRFTELDPNQSYYIHCKAGVRSLKALNFLRQQGFKYLKSVKGGITRRSRHFSSLVAVPDQKAPIIGQPRRSQSRPTGVS